ncbi:uncharacterized protein LOC110858841 [Folsomia candida]|uniref:uncharacterized protein LOC110858841 n=1 Tax=Folsomia candida TaxID=158441 RepID=UPI001604AD88|nr:uncharacterized protein LOC110858841 [Folsomia candida]
MPHPNLIFILTFTLLLLPHDVLNQSKPFTPQEMRDARLEALKWNNIFRKWHNGTPTMTLNDELNDAAQQRAEYFISGKPIPTTIGENVYKRLKERRAWFDAKNETEGAVKTLASNIIDKNNPKNSPFR